MSDTPRTDAYLERLNRSGYSDMRIIMCLRSHAQTLEAELAEARKDTKRLDLLSGTLARVDVELDDGDGPCVPLWHVHINGTRYEGTTLRGTADKALEWETLPK